MFSLDERKEDLAANIRFLQELKDKRNAEPNRNSEMARNYSVAITGLERVIAYARYYIERDTKS